MAVVRSRALTCKTCSISRLLLQRLRAPTRDWILGEGRICGRPHWAAPTASGGARSLAPSPKVGSRTWSLFALTASPSRPLNNPINQLVYSGRKPVDLVMVDGEVILANGRLTRIDEDRLLEEIRAVHARLTPLLMAAEKDGERFTRPFERIYRRCQDIEIASDTYPAHLSH